MEMSNELMQGLTYNRGLNDGIAISVGSKDAVGTLFNRAWVSGKKEQFDAIVIHQLALAARDRKSSNWGILDPVSGLFSIQEPRFILPDLIKETSLPHVAEILKGDAKDDLKKELMDPSTAFRKSNRKTGQPYKNSWGAIYARADPRDRVEYSIPNPSGPLRAEGLKFGRIQWFSVPKPPPAPPGPPGASPAPKLPTPKLPTRSSTPPPRRSARSLFKARI